MPRKSKVDIDIPETVEFIDSSVMLDSVRVNAKFKLVWMLKKSDGTLTVMKFLMVKMYLPPGPIVVKGETYIIPNAYLVHRDPLSAATVEVKRFKSMNQKSINDAVASMTQYQIL